MLLRPFTPCSVGTKPKITYVDGLAASAASVIAMVGDKRIMPNNAMLMIHKGNNCNWKRK